jgi:hypothetical protein
MSDDERLERLLRAALQRPATPGPSRDLWPSIVSRSQAPVGVSWLDVGVAAVVALVLLLRPGWLWLLAYHL